MLKHLKQTEIDEIIAICEGLNAKATGKLVLGKDVDIQETPEQKHLYALIGGLSGDALRELIALMWTGGVDSDRSFAENLERAQKSMDKEQVSYVVGKSAALPTYLRAGLKKLKSN